MSNLQAMLTLNAEPVLPENYCILEIHLHDNAMDVRFYKPYSSDDVIITAKTLQGAIDEFHCWYKETDELIKAMSE